MRKSLAKSNLIRCRIFNFMVVEVTPPGIASLHWRFYIIWTVFNFAFIPIGKRYISYPPPHSSNTSTVYFFYPETAGRSLEDIDRVFVGNTPLLIFRDKEAIAEKRPERFIQLEHEEVRRHSSVVPAHVQAANAGYRNSVVDDEKSFDGNERKETV